MGLILTGALMKLVNHEVHRCRSEAASFAVEEPLQRANRRFFGGKDMETPRNLR